MKQSTPFNSKTLSPLLAAIFVLFNGTRNLVLRIFSGTKITKEFRADSIAKSIKEKIPMNYGKALEAAKRGFSSADTILNEWDAECNTAINKGTYHFNRKLLPLSSRLSALDKSLSGMEFEELARKHFNISYGARAEEVEKVKEKSSVTKRLIDTVLEQKIKVDAAIGRMVEFMFKGIAPTNKELFDIKAIFKGLWLLLIGVEAVITSPIIIQAQLMSDVAAIFFSVVCSVVLGLLAEFSGSGVSLKKWVSVIFANLTAGLILSSIFFLRQGSEFELLLAGLNVAFYGLMVLLSWRYYYHKPYWENLRHSKELGAEIDLLSKEQFAEESKLNRIEMTFQSFAVEEAQYEIRRSEEEVDRLSAKEIDLTSRKEDFLNGIEAIRELGRASIKMAWNMGSLKGLTVFIALSIMGMGCVAPIKQVDVLVAVDKTRAMNAEDFQDPEEVAGFILKKSLEQCSSYFYRYKVTVIFSTVGQGSIPILDPIEFTMDDQPWEKNSKIVDNRTNLFRQNLKAKIEEYFEARSGLTTTNLNRAMAWHLNYLAFESKADRKYYLLFSDLLQNDGTMNWHSQKPTLENYEEIEKYLRTNAQMPDDLSEIDCYFVFAPGNDVKIDQQHHSAKAIWKKYLESKNGEFIFLPNLL